MKMSSEVSVIIRRILDDLRVELSDEFDENFEREGFFSESWQRRISPLRGDGHILVDTGQLRRSIESRIDGNSITFFTTLPYAGIHNDGGEIVVTAKMKKYFWWRWKSAEGSFSRKKDGEVRKTKKNARLQSESDFWKWMALKKIGSKIRIPRRRFLGSSPEVERIVREVIEENLGDALAHIVGIEH